MSARSWMLLLAAALCCAACSPPLPEPESEGAKLYASRCNTCHRVFAPSSLKYEMWKMQVDRMQGEMVRHGMPPLTTEERDVVLDYLKRHSG
jgi:cytochrome c5